MQRSCVFAGALVAAAVVAAPAVGQTPPRSTLLLDQMLAPIALYPDPLLAEVLMAATYPAEVTVADQWIADPKNAALDRTHLAAAIEPMRWDPSVKSLVAFAPVLHMMSANREWSDQLGDAVLADQRAVLASIQRLRRLAQAAGNLKSAPQETVGQEGQAITISPAEFGTFYVAVYDPAAAYGTWRSRDFPPQVFKDALRAVTAGNPTPGWFGVDVAPALRNWTEINWRRNNLYVDPDRFAAISAYGPPPGNGVWQHDPLHRAGLAYSDPSMAARIARRAAQPDEAPDTSEPVLPERSAANDVPADLGQPYQGYAPGLDQGYGGYMPGQGLGYGGYMPEMMQQGYYPGGPGFGAPGYGVPGQNWQNGRGQRHDNFARPAARLAPGLRGSRVAGVGPRGRR